MGLDAIIFPFWMLSFKPVFLLSSFTFIKRLFNSSLFSAIRVVSSAYLRLLVFLPEILIPACASSSLAFHMRYSAYKLNKQGDNIQPWHTSFPIWNQSVVPRRVLTVASWPAHRHLALAFDKRMHVRNIKSTLWALFMWRNVKRIYLKLSSVPKDWKNKWQFGLQVNRTSRRKALNCNGFREWKCF